MSKVVRGSVGLMVPAAAASLLLAACGGSSTTGDASTTPSGAHGGRSSSAAAVSDAAGVARSKVEAARGVSAIPRLLGSDTVIPSRTGPVKARSAAGVVDDEVNASGAKTVDPCTLVGRAEAQAILGKPVGQPVDAPQGPTCIYKAQGAKSFVTLAVQAAHFSTVAPQSQLRDRISVSIAGHTAYCGVAGSPTMIVPLTAGRFLTVTAPCPLAASFASKALSRIA
jgi:hypothetical protein